MSNTQTPIDPVDNPEGSSEHDPFGSWANLSSDPIPPRRPESTRRPTRSRTWITTGAAAATLGIGGYFGVGAMASHTRSVANASASTGGPQGAGGLPSGAGGGPPGGGGTVGTIKSINGSSLTVLTRSGATDTVDFSSTTTVTKSTTGSVSDIKVGDHLVINGTGTSTVSATSITDGGTSNLAGGQGGPGGGGGGGGAAPPTGSGTSTAAGGTSSSGTAQVPPSGQFGGGSFVQGTVTAVGSDSITIKETSGTTATVSTSSSTTVTVLEAITASDLQAGQTVSVQGTTANGVVTATSIREGTAFGG